MSIPLKLDSNFSRTTEPNSFGLFILMWMHAESKNGNEKLNFDSDFVRYNFFDLFEVSVLIPRGATCIWSWKSSSSKKKKKKKKKKNHVIRVVFRDQAMYASSPIRGAKTCKIAKKGVFLVILTNFGKDMTDKLRKPHAERVKGMFWKSLNEDDIEPDIQVPPPFPINPNKKNKQNKTK